MSLRTVSILKNVKAYLSHLWRETDCFNRWNGSSSSTDPVSGEMPLRDELFCAEQMEQHAKYLAMKHTLGELEHQNRLLSRLQENERCLIGTHALLTEAVKNKLPIVPAGEWLLDNFYLIDEQVRIARRHLPKHYSRELPRLAKGPSIGLPRVYDLALEMISHGDGRIDRDVLMRFIVSYQSVTPLLLGELWAIPIMLRLAMIENLRRVSVRIADARMNVNLAQTWANRMIEVAEKDPKSLILIIADMVRSRPPMVSAFVAELERCLKGHGSALALPLTWMKQRLAESSLTIEQLVLSENQRQAADQVTVSNTIGSLRFLGAIDWREFIEAVSLVEKVLSQDQGGVYSSMDFSSRDRYRQVVDGMAKHCVGYKSMLAQTEINVAQTAMNLAQSGAEKNGIHDHTAHVGYYLIDQGRPILEAMLGVQLSASERIRRCLRRAPLLVYLGAILLLTMLCSSVLLIPLYRQGVTYGCLAMLSIVVILAFSQLGSALVNWLITLTVKPKLLPRMDYSQGLPADMRTLVVIPCMLHSAQNIADLVEALEVRFLGCRDDYLNFALLSDFCDANVETLPQDESLLALACHGIERLNRKYPISGSTENPDQKNHIQHKHNKHKNDHINDQINNNRFFLLHRPRRWNPKESQWMGYERKRGKLMELNAALRGAGWNRFSTIRGNVSLLSDVKYIITLDTDTELPRDSAQQFVATMAHPLNRPRYDHRCRRVVGGYGILQPRMAASLSGANRSRYAQLCGNEPGIDPYTRSISDIYQDLFAEGSFVGKGIYDIDAFEYVLDKRFPENRILSHDLLEGCYARSGLLSDVQLYEEYPARYLTDIARQQRWVRGDWQIVNWLFPKVPNAEGHNERNPLSMLSQWKILDNLRRSLLPIVFTILLLVGWFGFSQPWRWTLVVLAIALIPPILAGVVDALRRPQEVLYRRHLVSILRSARQNLTLSLFRLACLPFEAWINLSAILRTTLRVLVTRKRLLEWQVVSDKSCPEASHPDYRVAKNVLDRDPIVAAYRAMWIAPAAALSVTLASGFSGLAVLIGVMPVAAMWLLAPFFSWWFSKPLMRHTHTFRDGQLLYLRRIARKTWSFFDCFVSARNHWLPPDNFQEHPGPKEAHRTSPTNIGLSLLANVSAADFGYISIGALLKRCTDTFATLNKLERYQGHFFNWYDTETLQPLPPRYISSVDSGNLAGHLLTLRAALLELPTQAILSPRIFDGLVDSVGVLQEAVTAALIALDPPRSSSLDPGIAADESQQSIRYERVKTVFNPKELAKLQLLLEAAVTLQPITLSGIFSYLQQITQVSTSLALAAVNLDRTCSGPENGSTEARNRDGSGSDATRAASVAVGGPTVFAQRADEKILEATRWLQAVAAQAQDGLDDLLSIAPWLTMSHTPNTTPGAMSSTMSSAMSSAMQTVLAFKELPTFDDIPTLSELQQSMSHWFAVIDRLMIEQPSGDMLELRRRLEAGRVRIEDRIATAHRLAQQAGAFATVEYEFLYDRSRHLLAVGYNVDECRCDTSYYDLLASEARLCNFVAIAQGKLPQESWFALGRVLTKVGGEPVLVSWSGSMFEYLMPLLVMPLYDCSLLEQSCRAAVTRHIAYGKQRGLPWGVSESGYNIVDANLNYQYHAFGVPGLGLKRGLAEASVVAPYASALALMIAPEQACQNLQQLSSEGFEGRFGFYEAIDYSPGRLLHDQTHTVVYSYMAHHQGMVLLSLSHLLLQQPMQRRFVSDPALQATLLLLQERIPKTRVQETCIADHSEGNAFTDELEASLNAPIDAGTPTPEVQLLSNGRYQVMVTNAGGGYSRWRGLALSRWREDSVCDNWGTFIYLRDLSNAVYWSAAHQPTAKPADSYAALFSEGRAEFRRRDGNIETYTVIVISPEDDIELRRVRLSNHAQTTKTIELTSCAEVVLSSPEADAMQTSFGKLFVQTEILDTENAILCSRRPRSIEEKTPWLFHLMGFNGSAVGDVSFETDRMRFIGRGRTSAAPQAMIDTAPLSGTQGSVLDPLVAIRCAVVLEPRQSVTIDLIFGAADSRQACMTLIERYQDRHLTDRVVDLAGTHSGVILRQINAQQLEAQWYRRLASAVIYATATLRADPSVLIQNRRGQSGLWGYAISGDLPIVLLKITDIKGLDYARQLIQCHAYWRLKGLKVDLLIWNENHIGYRQQLQDQIMGLIASDSDASTMDRPGGVFVRFAEQISLEDRILLQAAARIIIVDSAGSLMEQLTRRSLANTRVARLVTNTLARSVAINVRSKRQHPPLQKPPLILANPLGGFSADGTEYIITTSAASLTPTPWVNVIANPGFGTVVSESGVAYSWSENAHEFRLTPWSDDPVGATGGEAIYLRDEISGEFWSPTAQPCSNSRVNSGAGSGTNSGTNSNTYQTRHGFGYSVFEYSSAEHIHSTLSVFVDLEEPVKYSVLRVRNDSGSVRELSATGYVEWVLGDLRTKTAMHVVTHIDAASGALFACNDYNTDFAGRVAFFDVDDLSRTLSGDRCEFLGRNGSLANPDAMTRIHLSGRVGAALDPCGALQVSFTLAAGEEREIIFRLGAGRDHAHASALAKRLRIPGTASAALARVKHYWRHTLSAVQIETPDAALNVMANGWLVYQTLASRLWARSGFYQSGGAYGFRDQLQDAMALVHSQPELLRAQILLCGQHQYVEGDVQHWWHPPSGRGVRTRCSDDFLWLPLATCRYVQSTGDVEVLNESLHYLDGRMLNPDEESYYDVPGCSPQVSSLYEHCCQAIEHGLRFGEHGLPLMGSGDWNDGMSLVGIHGKGESVWLGFFLYKVLISFAEVALAHQDPAFSERCQQQAEALCSNLEQHAWDGDWYKRAWFDDGAPLGSASNEECRIDSICQSWSVLSGAGDKVRSRQAMDALDKHLVMRDPGFVRLLDPPFDKSSLEPGYIKGYVPGVRENGGQYTHAAVWAAMAFAELGDSARAWELVSLINPINHSLSAEAVATYKTEPYVVAADVYGLAPHQGRGGWSWYTGSAGWLYRFMIESLMGLSRQSNRLIIKPCLPETWTNCSIRYRYGETLYRINIEQRTASGELGLNTLTLDGVEVEVDVDAEKKGVLLLDDQIEHQVDVVLYRVS